ncbi:MAG: S66 family peptidase [Peptostreptococcaceae bacterium]
MELIKPKHLKRGDKVATVSLSWGGAGDEEILWRYYQGKKRLEEEFGLCVVEMENTLKGSEYIYNHPEKRAKDLMDAFKDPSITGIFSCIGGDESVRILPYIDFEVIRNNPKIFMGYSDTTVTHMICLQSGITSFYGPSILAEFAENVEMFDYTKYWINEVLFNNKPVDNIHSSSIWTSEYLPWLESNKDIQRKTYKNKGYEVLQGSGIVRGHLIGGCIEVLEMLKGTEVWPSKEMWDNAILFFETSEDTPEPKYLEYWLRNYGSQGVFDRVSGIIFGKPYDNKYYDEYKEVILKVIGEELRLKHIPIMYNMNFGHTAPMMVLPYGCMGEINCDKLTFRIIDSAVR